MRIVYAPTGKLSRTISTSCISGLYTGVVFTVTVVVEVIVATAVGTVASIVTTNGELGVPIFPAASTITDRRLCVPFESADVV